MATAFEQIGDALTRAKSNKQSDRSECGRAALAFTTAFGLEMGAPLEFWLNSLAAPRRITEAQLAEKIVSSHEGGSFWIVVPVRKLAVEAKDIAVEVSVRIKDGHVAVAVADREVTTVGSMSDAANVEAMRKFGSDVARELATAIGASRWGQLPTWASWTP